MNLLKSFSSTTGIEPNDSFIYQKFFPLPFTKYIVLETQNDDQNLNYVFWSRVVQLIEPFLSKNSIEIVNFVDDKKQPFSRTCIDKETSLSEKAYMLNHSMLYCGSSKFYSLICSEKGIPQIFLKTDYLVDNLLLGENEIINTNKASKNFFNPIGNFINNIRPEEIAVKILSKLSPEENYDFDRTLSIGKVYSFPTMDLIPDCSFKITNDSKNEILVRMDEFFSEANLADQLKNGPASIVTNRDISKNILLTYKNSIKKIYFKVQKGSDPSFIDLLESFKFNYDIITSLNDKDLEPEKLKYLNYKIINKLNKMDLSFLDGLDKSKVFFKTNKIIIKSGKTFASKWHCRAGINHPDVRNGSFPLPQILDDSFKEEADSFYFLTNEKI
jgi:hypothetical protein